MKSLTFQRRRTTIHFLLCIGFLLCAHSLSWSHSSSTNLLNESLLLPDAKCTVLVPISKRTLDFKAVIADFDPQVQTNSLAQKLLIYYRNQVLKSIPNIDHAIQIENYSNPSPSQMPLLLESVIQLMEKNKIA